MPNWCSNVLTVSGSDKEVKLFDKMFKQAKTPNYPPQYEGQVQVPDDKEYSYSAFVPVPQVVVESPYSHDDETKRCGYDWQVANWGVKWDVDMGEVLMDEGCVTYWFDSPWGAPLQFVKKASELFPTLMLALEAEEPGMEFHFYTEFQGGVEKMYEDRPMTPWEE